MENCSQPAEVQTLNSIPTVDVAPDLTEDLNKQLEDIISFYQAAEKPAENEELEEEAVTDIKESGKAKDPRLEKKMLKGLGEALFLVEHYMNGTVAQSYHPKEQVMIFCYSNV